MERKKLYIIGNGFDLHHEIRSAYGDFKAFLKKEDWSLFRLVEDYLPVGQEWNELEMALGDIDVAYMVDNNAMFLPSYAADDWSDSGHHDFQYEISKIVNNLSSTLRTQFANWVRQIEIPDATSAQNRLSTLDINGLYLTFNYTSTLASVYSVPMVNILHIHGEAALPDTVVLGHAWNPNERKSLNDHSGVEDQDTQVTEAYDILDGYFSATFKPLEKIIQENAPFFAGLRNIEEVFVLGHSLSDVDLNYFEAVVKAIDIDAVRWAIACRNSVEMEDKHAAIAMLGVPARRIYTQLWNDI
ncbi:MAG: bacteriophage abortive infection AbiH family protein [Gallionella sp.]|nr:bacteriophage abortive infection AbiH family protein [Gallionella sp.]